MPQAGALRQFTSAPARSTCPVAGYSAVLVAESLGRSHGLALASLFGCPWGPHGTQRRTDYRRDGSSGLGVPNLHATSHALHAARVRREFTRRPGSRAQGFDHSLTQPLATTRCGPIASRTHRPGAPGGIRDTLARWSAYVKSWLVESDVYCPWMSILQPLRVFSGHRAPW